MGGEVAPAADEEKEGPQARQARVDVAGGFGGRFAVDAQRGQRGDDADDGESEGHRGGGRDEEALEEDAPRLAPLARADGLGHERVDAQHQPEADDGDREVEAAAEPHGAEGHLAQSPDHGGVDDADELIAQVAQGQGDGDREETAGLGADGGRRHARLDSEGQDDLPEGAVFVHATMRLGDFLDGHGVADDRREAPVGEARQDRRREFAGEGRLLLEGAGAEHAAADGQALA